MSVMPLTVYLAISASGRVKATKGPPALGPDEICFELNLKLAEELFYRPALRAAITVTKDDAPQVEVRPDLIPVVSDAIRQATGLDVRVSLVESEEGR